MPRARKTPTRPAPPKRQPRTTEQLHEAALKLHEQARRWWPRLTRAVAALQRIERRLASLRRAAKRGGHSL